MARLGIVEKKESELKKKGVPEASIAEELEKVESPIAWNILHHFDPTEFPEEMSVGFKAKGVESGNMSYGFSLTMPGGKKRFLKVEKAPDIQRNTSVEIDEAQVQETLLKLAEYLHDNGVPSAKPIRSGGEDGIQPFIKTMQKDESLPKEIEGLKVSLFDALSGPEVEMGNAEKHIVNAARAVGLFQRYGAEYVEEKKMPGLDKDAFNVFKTLNELPERLKTFLKDVGLNDLDASAEDLKSGAVNFDILMSKNNQHVEKELVTLESALDSESSHLTHGQRIEKMKETYLEKLSSKFSDLETAAFPNCLKKLDTHGEDKEFIEQGFKIAHLEQVQQLSEVAQNGKLANFIDALATINKRHQSLVDLPKGFMHNDAHCGNFMVDAERLAIIDFDEATRNGPLIRDFTAVIQTFLPEDGITKEKVKPALAEYDAARNSKKVPRLGEKEADNSLLSDTALTAAKILRAVHEFTVQRDDFSAEYNKGNMRASPMLSKLMDFVVDQVDMVKNQPFGEWLQESRRETVDALDLAGMEPKLSHKRLKEQSQRTGNKDKQANSWVDESAKNSKLNTSPGGSRDI